jgi:hypothetical protein
LDGADAGFLEDPGEVCPGFGHEFIGEKVAIAVDDAQTGFFIFNAFHMFLQFRKNVPVPVTAAADPPETGQNGITTPRGTGFAAPEASVF